MDHRIDCRMKNEEGESDGRMMGRRRKKEASFGPLQIFFSRRGDKAHTCCVVNQRPFLTRHPRPDLRRPADGAVLMTVAGNTLNLP